MTKTKSLRAMLHMAILRAVIITVTVAWAMAIVSRMPAPAAERPHAEGSPRAVVESFGDKCWSDAAPADMKGKIPGHVIYAKDASGALVGGHTMVMQALDQLFSGADNGLTVYAFCR